MSYIKNVLIAGATGSVGTPILKALLDEPYFNVTILTRANSSAKFPDGIPVKKISGDYTTSELTEAFKGQDAVVVAISTAPVAKEGKGGLAFRLIDAAIAAGVKRFIPSEYAGNNLDPRARSIVPVYDLKGEMLEHLISEAAETNGGLTWTSIACGSWLDWALSPSKSGNFLGIDIKAQTATVYDSGRSRFAVTSSTNTGIAVTRVLMHPEITTNKQVFLCDFMTTSRDIVENLEKHTRGKFSVTQKDSRPEVKALRERFEDGDFDATYGLVALGFIADIDVGFDFEKDQEIWNDKLGLPKVTLDDVVKEAMVSANRS